MKSLKYLHQITWKQSLKCLHYITWKQNNILFGWIMIENKFVNCMLIIKKFIYFPVNMMHNMPLLPAPVEGWV